MVVVQEEQNRNVVVVEGNNRNVVVKGGGKQQKCGGGGGGVNLFKFATFYLFLSLHSAHEELTWVGSVPFAKNRLEERTACKGTWCVNTAKLVSPHFKQFQCLQQMSEVSLRASFYLLGFRGDPVWKDSLGSISITTSVRCHLPSPGQDRLV